ncbi:hypothetical protein DF030_31580 [Burkholderia cenocepacia]|nr:hypothetical protein DF030_31580 [Burkholderia cenocepacia]
MTQHAPRAASREPRIHQRYRKSASGWPHAIPATPVRKRVGIVQNISRAELIEIPATLSPIISVWPPTQRQLAHPATDLVLEIRHRCELAGLQPPSRTAIGGRSSRHPCVG